MRTSSCTIPRPEVSSAAPDVGKLRRLTGFEARIPLDQGLAATANFYLRDRLSGPLAPLGDWQV